MIDPLPQRLREIAQGLREIEQNTAAKLCDEAAGEIEGLWKFNHNCWLANAHLKAELNRLNECLSMDRGAGIPERSGSGSECT